MLKIIGIGLIMVLAFMAGYFGRHDTASYDDTTMFVSLHKDDKGQMNIHVVIDSPEGKQLYYGWSKWIPAGKYMMIEDGKNHLWQSFKLTENNDQDYPGIKFKTQWFNEKGQPEYYEKGDNHD